MSLMITEEQFDHLIWYTAGVVASQQNGKAIIVNTTFSQQVLDRLDGGEKVYVKTEKGFLLVTGEEWPKISVGPAPEPEATMLRMVGF